MKQSLFFVLVLFDLVFAQCNAFFTLSTNSISLGGTVDIFDSSNSTDPFSTNISYDLYDGGGTYIMNLGNTFPSGMLTSPSINTSGLLEVRALLNDFSDGCTSSYSEWITVSCTPTASFTPTTTTYSTGSSVLFSSTSLGAGSYSWTVNGTPVSSSASFSYTFSTAGSYNVCLTIMGSGGCSAMSDNICRTINIVAPGIKYVKPVASGTGDGSSWANAMSDLSAALVAATSGEQVWVAAGVYHPSLNNTGGAPATPRHATFLLKEGVSLYGGFVGTETSIAERATALCGSRLTELTGDFGAAGKSFHTLTISGTTTALRALIDGFHITNGNATGAPDYNGGGGVYAFTNLDMNDCVVENNHATIEGGGAIFCVTTGHTINVSNTIFRYNTCDDDGAGASTNGCGGGLLTFIDCLFHNNTSGNGGGGNSGSALRVKDTPVDMYNCTVSQNSTADNGAIYHHSNVFRVYNSIFYDDVGGELVGLPIDVSFSNNIEGGGGTMNLAPLFTNPAMGDFTLQATSPCVNAGNNAYALTSLDLGRQARITSGTIDMGAYEYTSATPVDPCAVFPVIMSSFNANLEGNAVNLNWITRSEINTHYFEVYRSLDAVDFEKIGEVSAAGNSSLPLVYHFQDLHSASLAPVLYYQIKTVDLDGSASLSNIAAVKMASSEFLQVFPNPAKEKINIELPASNEENMLLIYDMKGALVYKEFLSTHTKSLDISTWKAGIYHLQVQGNSSLKTSFIVE